MKFDALLRVGNLADAAQRARDYEDSGFDGLWAAEKDHDPYLILALAACATTRTTIGTAIALAFTRSPMSIAQTAWNLQAASGGRFVLGLGSQVRAHIERRFSCAWERPVERMREVVLAIRSIWRCWQTGDKLAFHGEFYRFDLMTPAFTPPPLGVRTPPIYLGAVNPRMIALAGEHGDGIHVHPFHSQAYLRGTIIPALHEGAGRAGRSPSELAVCVSAFCVTDEVSRRAVAEQLSFYASTRAYRPVLAAHGWEEVGAELGRMAAAGSWDRMPDLISDDMIETFALVGGPGDIRRLARARYGDIVDRLTINEGPAAGRMPRG